MTLEAGCLRTAVSKASSQWRVEPPGIPEGALVAGGDGGGGGVKGGGEESWRRRQRSQRRRSRGETGEAERGVTGVDLAVDVRQAVGEPAGVCRGRRRRRRRRRREGSLVQHGRRADACCGRRLTRLAGECARAFDAARPATVLGLAAPPRLGRAAPGLSEQPPRRPRRGQAGARRRSSGNLAGRPRARVLSFHTIDRLRAPSRRGARATRPVLRHGRERPPAGRCVADRTRGRRARRSSSAPLHASRRGATSALSKTRSSVVAVSAVHAPPNLEPAANVAGGSSPTSTAPPLAMRRSLTENRTSCARTQNSQRRTSFPCTT